MPEFVIDLSNVRQFSNLRAFPDGWYTAQIVEGVVDTDQNGDLMTEFAFEIFSDEHGSATIKQKINKNQAFIMLPLWLAVNDMERAEFDALSDDARSNVRVDPERLVGSDLLVCLGTRQGRTPRPDGTLPEYKNIVSPFFMPSSRWSELNDAGQIR